MNKRKKIINVEICGSGIICSGGEKCFVELIKQFCLLGYEQEIFLGLDKGRNDIVHNKKVKLIFLKKQKKERSKNKILTLFLYGTLFLRSFFALKKYKEDIIILSHSDAWPDVIFAYMLKILNPKAHWVAINHMLLPEKKHDTNTSFIRFYNYLNQRVFFLFQRKSDLLVSVNEMYGDELNRYNKNTLIIKYGKEKKFDKVKSFKERNIDICFIGRFFHQKGVYQILDICKEIDGLLPKDHPKLSFLLIGEINSVAKEIRSELKKVEHRFIFNFIGFKGGDDKYELLGSSKLFMFPSLFESFGIVYLDAISVGTPVIEYDLEYFKNHKGGVIKVPFLDNKIFAQRVVDVLTNENIFEQLSREGHDYASNFSWRNTALSILDKINED